MSTTLTRRALGAFALAATLSMTFSGCSTKPSYRYKMVVEVETPQGVKIGTAVRAVSFHVRMEGGDMAKVRGEAVAVDLPGGQSLFALLSGHDGFGDYSAWIADWALKRPLSTNGANAGYEAGRFAEIYPTRPKTKSPIGTTSTPLLVRFKNIADPKSVERVDPAALDAAFGAGVTLKRITVEVTDDPVTLGIEKRLPEPDEKGFFNWDGKSNPNELGVVGIWEFKKGFDQ